MIIARLALRDLLRDKFYLICNVATMVGILVPLLVLFGVKNGIYKNLIDDLLANPATLQIDTIGNGRFTQADIDPLLTWEAVAFVTPKTRSLFDSVNVRSEGSKRIVSSYLVPSGAGDPNLPAGATLAPNAVMISQKLATQMKIRQGGQLDLITQAEGRPHQLILPVTVSGILSDTRVGGYTILAPLPLLELVEAFYDGYALPEHGVEQGEPLQNRKRNFAGVRVYAKNIFDLAALQAKMETHLGIRTQARTREVQSVLGLGRNLDLALAMTASIAAMGLVASLVFGFWTDVLRKRRILAAIALMGVNARQLALFPMIQAMITAVISLGVSFSLYLLASRVATGLFGGSLSQGNSITSISLTQAAWIAGAVLFVVGLSSLFAARSAQKMDPAIILREVS